MKRIAAFITPHGFGHTTRAIAILETLQRRCPELSIEIFTTVSEHLFCQSLKNFRLHHLLPDVGLIQYDALKIDIPATIAALDELLPFAPEHVRRLAEEVQDCSCVLCDIAPLGIIVAEAAGIPSILIENFTWDWIYQPYTAAYPALGRHALSLAAIYKRATIHVQTEPVCNPVLTAHVCPPIFRKVRSSALQVRQQLGTGEKKLILISLGGLDFTLPHWQQLDTLTDYFFVLAGQAERRIIAPNCLALPHHSDFYHPDLIQAADLVVFKSGYSTVAECLQAGTRAACIARSSFAESAVLANFVEKRLGGIVLDEHDFIAGKWLDHLPEILALPTPPPAAVNGADYVVDLLLPLS